MRGGAVRGREAASRHSGLRCGACDGKGNGQHHPSGKSALALRLADMERSIAQLAESLSSKAIASMSAQVLDVCERLERVELLLFSCSFEQFREIDEALHAFREGRAPGRPPSAASADAPPPRNRPGERAPASSAAVAVASCRDVGADAVPHGEDRPTAGGIARDEPFFSSWDDDLLDIDLHIDELIHNHMDDSIWERSKHASSASSELPRNSVGCADEGAACWHRGAELAELSFDDMLVHTESLKPQEQDLQEPHRESAGPEDGGCLSRGAPRAAGCEESPPPPPPLGPGLPGAAAEGALRDGAMHSCAWAG